jgi:hypothetical protein
MGAEELNALRASFENTARWGVGLRIGNTCGVIPAWNAGSQADMDVSGSIFATWMDG